MFRGTQGIAAISNHCTHRGARLSQGRCFYEGTVSCPYHGWTYDEHGKCVAVLSEGPESAVPAAHASVKSYPVRELKDIVFVWMGEGEPSDPSVDLMPELFDPNALVMNDVTIWPANWRPVARELQRQPRVVRPPELTRPADDPVDQDLLPRRATCDDGRECPARLL